MAYDGFVTLINSVGFPIACSIYLVYTVNNINNAHREDMEKLRQTIENNTIVMNKICAKIGIDEEV